MNNQQKKIIEYIDGSMNSRDQILFEKEIEKSIDLQKEIEKVKHFLATVKSDSVPSVNETYFTNILPQFHRQHSVKRKFSFSKAAYSLATIAAAILIVFILFNPAKTNEYEDLNELSANLSDKEVDETLNQFENPYSLNDLLNAATAKTDSVVNNMIKAELNLSSGIANNSVADQYVSTDDILNSLNENEVNELYSQLINEDIINGAK